MPDCNVKEQNLSERKGRKCHIPRHRSQVMSSVTSMRDSSFQVNGPQLFNQLPKYIRDLTKCSIDEFKHEVDKFLQTIPDEPKCPGLTPVAQRPDGVHSNSLLHQVPWARRNGLLRDFDY